MNKLGIRPRFVATSSGIHREFIAAELVRLRVLKEHELGVELKEAPKDSGPYVPKVEK